MINFKDVVNIFQAVLMPDPDPECPDCGRCPKRERHAPWCPSSGLACRECGGKRGKHAPWCKRGNAA